MYKFNYWGVFYHEMSNVLMAFAVVLNWRCTSELPIDIQAPSKTTDDEFPVGASRFCVSQRWSLEWQPHADIVRDEPDGKPW